MRGDLSQFNRDIATGGDKGARTLSDKIKGAFSPRNLAVAGIGAGIAIGSAVVAGLADATRALIDIERLNAQTDAAIKSTGGAANVTRQDIENLSESMESLTTIERETVQEGANLLLTFKRIRNEAGEGNDIFDRATETALDLSVALGTDMRSASMMLGKALDDPIRGVTALRRAGVALTQQQQDQVKAFVEAGDTLSAQRIILAELETQVAGSAEAFANTTAGKIQRFQNEVGNMFESIILGAIKVGEFLTDDPLEGFAMNFGEQGDRVHDIADRFGQDFDDLKVRIETRMDQMGESFTEAANHIEGELANASVAAQREAGQMMVGVGDAISEGLEREVEPEIERMASMPSEALRDEYNNIRNAAYESQVAYAMGLMDGQNQPQVAFDAAMRLVEEEMTEAEEIAELKGKLLTLSHAQGIAAAEGKAASVNAINATIELITARLEYLTGEAYSWGGNLASSYAAGIVNNLGLVHDAGRQLAQGVGSQVRIESEPPDHRSPLYGITKWGGNIVKTIAEGIYGQLSTGTAAANALAGSLIPSMPVGTPLAAGVAGETRVYQLYVDGKEKVVGGATDVLSAWEQMEGF